MKVLSRTFRSHHIVAGVLFAAWVIYVASLLPFFFANINTAAKGFQQFANENKESIEELNKRKTTDIDVESVEQNVKSELESVQILRTTVALLGFGAATMAFFVVRFWRPLVMVTSLLYMWLWYISGTTAYVPFAEAYRLKLMMAKMQGTMGWFLARDVLLPFVFTTMILYVAVESFLVGSKKDLSTK